MKVIIYGTGKQAEFTHYLFANDSSYDVVAFCLEQAFLPDRETTFSGIPVISLEEIIKDFSPSRYKMHIAIGDNNIREKMFALVKSKGFTCVSYICSKAQTWNDLEIGENVFIDQASTVHPLVKINNNSSLIGASVGHHCRIGRNVLISGSSLAGNVTVGDNSFLGLNSSIKENVVIGYHNIIGVGAFIGHDTQDNAVFSDHCSRKRNISADEIHLFR
ncbi:MAG: acetyltransferase [Chitinophagaceae bacterium]